MSFGILNAPGVDVPSFFGEEIDKNRNGIVDDGEEMNLLLEELQLNSKEDLLSNLGMTNSMSIGNLQEHPWILQKLQERHKVSPKGKDYRYSLIESTERTHMLVVIRPSKRYLERSLERAGDLTPYSVCLFKMTDSVSFKISTRLEEWLLNQYPEPSHLEIIEDNSYEQIGLWLLFGFYGTIVLICFGFSKWVLHEPNFSKLR